MNSVMGLLSKLKFWHKEDDLDFDTLADKEMGKTPAASDMGLDQSQGVEEKSPFGDEPEAFTGPRFQTSKLQNTSSFNQSPPANRDLELINSKLDTLKAILGSMDQRIAHLEQTIGVEKKQKLW